MKKKSALLVSISMVLVAVLALTTASFAWFTASMNPSLGEFDVQVSTSNALLVGVRKTSSATAIKDIVYSTSLNATDLAAGYVGDYTVSETAKNELAGAGKTLSNSTLKNAVATGSNASPTHATVTPDAGALPFYRLKSSIVPPAFSDIETTPGNDADIYDAATNDVTNKMDYVMFDMYFKANFPTTTGATKMNVMLDLGKDTDSVGSTFNALKDDKTPYKFADLSTGTDAEKEAAKAYWITTSMRIAFIANPVDTATEKSTAGTTAASLEVDSRQPAEIVNPYMDAKRQYTTTASRAYTASDTYTVPASNLQLFEMTNNTVVRLRVYMWLEGNDKQCFNDVSAAKFRSIFKFIGTMAA